MPASQIPAGFHAVTPYMIVTGADRVLDFLRAAFDATEVVRMKRPDGTISHAGVRVEGSMVELSEASGPWGPLPGALDLYVPDCDAAYRRAVEAGGESLYPPTDMFYGERSAGVSDPGGNQWYLATHTEVVTGAELDRRAKAFAAGVLWR